MKILAISDTHCLHKELKIPDNIDMIIHAGDFSNSKSPHINYNESIDFLIWYHSLDVKYKILIAGNHSTSIEAKLINFKEFKTITYLEHESINIEGINIFGSPYTPEFCNWAFNVDRHKIDKYWQHIPENTDILVTHGPPKGILDLAYDRNGVLEYCGDKSLYNHVQRVKPKVHIFGHIHNNDDNYNSGMRTETNSNTIYRNVSCVTDGKFKEGLSSYGQVFEY